MLLLRVNITVNFTMGDVDYAAINNNIDCEIATRVITLWLTHDDGGGDGGDDDADVAAAAAAADDDDNDDDDDDDDDLSGGLPVCMLSYVCLPNPCLPTG